MARLLAAVSAAAELVVRDGGVRTGTLLRWRDDVQTMPARERAWIVAARLQAVITTAAMAEADKNA